MQVIELEKTKPSLLKSSTNNFSAKNILAESFILKDKKNKEIIAIYKNDFLLEESENYYKNLNSFKFKKSNRLSGLHSESLIFGYAPSDARKLLIARKVKNDPEVNKFCMNLLIEANNFFIENFPEKAKAQSENNINKIFECWRMPGNLFTSGIINKSTQLMFHTDNGNMEKSMSVMFCFKKGIVGGKLFLPEYDVAIEIENGSALLFDGQSVAHGVERFRKLNSKSQRYTIVFYALEKLMEAQETFEEELKKFNKSQMGKLK